MDRGSTSTDTSAVPPIVGLAALQDLDILIGGIADLKVQRSVCRQVMDARRKLLGTEHPATLEAEARVAAIGLEMDEYSIARDQYGFRTKTATPLAPMPLVRYGPTDAGCFA